MSKSNSPSIGTHYPNRVLSRVSISGTFFYFWSPLSIPWGSNQAKNVSSIDLHAEIPHTIMPPKTSIIVPLLLDRCWSSIVKRQHIWDRMFMHYHFLQLCSGKNRQGSTSVTSFQNCDVPNVATKIIYLAVLHPVLNIFSVSCTLGPSKVNSKLSLSQTTFDTWELKQRHGWFILCFKITGEVSSSTRENLPWYQYRQDTSCGTPAFNAFWQCGGVLYFYF